MQPSVKIYNTLSQKKETLTPVTPGHVKIYACGVTVYDDCHIGHAMQAIFFDMMVRFLKSIHYQVTYVRNYTDVDDKIIDRAAILGMTPAALAQKMVDSCDEDMSALDVIHIDAKPKVSETIPEIISMVEGLIEKGFAYSTKQGDVYFRVRKKTDYGKLSNRQVDELLSGSRDLVQGEKEDPLDFALWKSDKTESASWQSPWGRGRPGWHIECSAMAKKYLGDHFDIHGGGRDLIFPHHENEIAQSEGANGCDYATIWVHSGLLTLSKQKMSKSLGNSIRIKDFLANWDPEVLRLSYLQNHYRSNIDFSDDVFRQARRRLLYFYETLKQIDQLKFAPVPVAQESLEEIRGFKTRFLEAMCDDFTTPMALAEMNQLARRMNQMLASPKAADRNRFLLEARKCFTEWGEAFGILQKNPSEFVETLIDRVLPELGVTRSEIAGLIAQRNEARLTKDWVKSDLLRDGLLARAIILRDGPEGTSFGILDKGS